ncbi:MAG: protein kinase, partial [Myxococcota bacterium]
MGEVWAATHVNARVDVAVKVIATEVAWSDRFRRAFRNEVRAAATLDHPGIVQVLDAGEITAAAAIASEGRLIAGSPWFVTERLVGGSLVDWVRSPRTWPELADLSQALLEALAHAHARGVIHRDVKPSNVLLDAGGRPRLTDFGIAQLQDARRGAGPAGAIAGQDGALEDLGTPAYLAPEQLLRVRAAIGPWTDLYAFGCTLWALVCGRPPFGDLRGESLRRAQLDPERPPLRPVLAVPTGLERVLHRTIAAAPNARYCRAIELATELGRLGGADRPAEAAPRPASPAPAPARDPSPSIPTVSIPTVSIPTVSIPTASVPVGGEGSEAALPSAPRAASVAPPVPDAIPADRERTTRALRGAGIGLFGLRAAPIVGRRAERQLLWDAFVPASRGQGPRVVVLTGPSGTGKTRLATWLCESAHALAGAEVWTAEHGPTDGGLDTLLASWLGVRSPRSSPELASVLAVRLAALPPGEPIEPEVVGELVAPTGRVRFTKPHERYAVIGAIIRRIAAERPVVLRLEDVQWGADALGLVAALHEAAIRRLTMVLTARDEVLAERPIERPLIRALVARPGASEIAVGPLPRRDRQRLIHALLPLEPSLAVRVAEHTGGNPLFTVQLVGELVANGSLEADESGFRLKTEATTGASLAELWTQRLEALLAGASGAAGIALELAAVLGMHVDGAEWRAVVDEAGAFVPPRLADRLVEAGLARTEGDPDEGFTFVHAMLRDVLLARAEDSGRLDGHHTAAAGWLAAQVGPGVTLRRGRHLLEAGSARAATEPLLDAAAELVSQAQFAEAVGVLASWEAAMTRAG